MKKIAMAVLVLVALFLGACSETHITVSGGGGTGGSTTDTHPVDSNNSTTTQPAE